MRNKLVHWMTDKDIRLLYKIPHPLPYLLLRAPRPVHKVAADFDMRTVNNFDFRANFFDQRNECRHLRVINDNDVCSTRSKRAAG